MSRRPGRPQPRLPRVTADETVQRALDGLERRTSVAEEAIREVHVLSGSVDARFHDLSGSVDSAIQTISGGGLTAVSHDSTLSGDGTSGSPLSANPTVTKINDTWTSMQVGSTASLNAAYGSLQTGVTASVGSAYSSLQTGVTASVATLSGTVNARFIDVSSSIDSRITKLNLQNIGSIQGGGSVFRQRVGDVFQLRNIVSRFTEPGHVSGSFVNSSDSILLTVSAGGVTASLAATYSSLQAGSTASIAAAYGSLQTGVTASIGAAYGSLQTGVTSSVNSAYTSLQAGITASVNSGGSGRTFFGRTTLTSTTSGSTVVITSGTTGIMLRMVGGGGGGGAQYTGGVSSMGGGGAGGAYLEKWITGSFGSLVASYQCGAAGRGQAGTWGVAGGDTIFALGGTTYLCKGGGEGFGQNWTVGEAAGGAAQAGSTAGAFQQEGFPGFAADVNNSSPATLIGGAGGNSPLGAGGGSLVATTSVGKNATGYGAGGGGILDNAATVALWGGSGSQGVIIIEEYS